MIKDRSWSASQRLVFIEQRLYWLGRVNRSDLIARFAISVPQAALDFRAYQEAAPENMVYDRSAKTYRIGPAFRPVFIDPDPSEFLNNLLEGLGDPLLGAVPVEAAPGLRRPLSAPVLRAIIAAITAPASVEVLYAGRDEATKQWHRITPHALGFDGLRWHARVWHHGREAFTDVVIGRIGAVGETAAPGASADLDVDWQRRIDVVLAAHPDLSEERKEEVAREFDLKSGERRVSVRAALAFYFLTSHPDIEPVLERPLWPRQLVVVNAEEVRAAILRCRGQVL